MEDWAEIRVLHRRERRDRRAIARRWGISRTTVDRALDCDDPPRYSRPPVETMFTPVESRVRELEQFPDRIGHASPPRHPHDREVLRPRHERKGSRSRPREASLEARAIPGRPSRGTLANLGEEVPGRSNRDHVFLRRGSELAADQSHSETGPLKGPVSSYSEGGLVGTPQRGHCPGFRVHALQSAACT